MPPTGPDSELVAEYRRKLARYVESRALKDLMSADPTQRGKDRGLTLKDMLAAQDAAIREIAAASGDGPQLAAAQEFFRRAVLPFERALESAGEDENLFLRLCTQVESKSRRIARSLHDEAAQMLASLHLIIAQMATHPDSGEAQLLERASRAVDDLDEYLRSLSHELRPTALDDLGLGSALRSLADSVSRHCGISVKVSGNTPGRLRDDVETALYRICQEALSNAERHAHASLVQIHVEQDEDTLACAVVDDGTGFDVAAIRGPGAVQCLGLSSMRTRAAAIGGRFEIWSVPGHGTRVQFWMSSAAAEVAEPARPKENRDEGLL